MRRNSVYMCKTPPILFLLAQTLSLLYSVSLSFSLTHTLLILFLCSLTRETVLNYPCCTVKCMGSFSQNLPLNHCSDNLLHPQAKSGYIFGSFLEPAMFWTDLSLFFLISHRIFSNDGAVLVSFKIITVRVKDSITLSWYLWRVQKLLNHWFVSDDCTDRDTVVE